ncbi:alpha-1,3-galactosidase-related protein [Seonamhaeicola maritimus]|uniref:alpha-1,3-galactosidase-related protein n=1 Tax=Seonamhaeicola maritimus TaxID=2591822 RepID=UPI0024959EC0|nr:right-handed parallel beta-helix repeat-containing protein [Seonamhaeicola maritimus]
MKDKILKLACLSLIMFCVTVASAQTVYEFSPTDSDITSSVRKAIENTSDKHIKLVFNKGVYRFDPKYAFERFSFITNHGNGYKKVIFRLENFESVEVEGNDSEFVFHGQVAPFQFEKCKNINVQNIALDWDIPFIFEAKVKAVNEEEGWMDVNPLTKGYSWKLKGNHISFPNIGGFSYHELGHTHNFNAETKSTAHGAKGLHLNPERVEKLKNGAYRFYQKLKSYPQVGTIIASKGEKGANRYAPAFQTQNCKDVVFDKVVVHHALGMGFLFERTENIQILNSGVYTKDGSDKYISSTADATHFANCKGDVLIENCRIESMLDDGTNVHGTYVEVDKIIDDYTVRVALKHFEQAGFEFAGIGDEVWFIQSPSPKRGQVNTVSKVTYINETYSDLKFESKIPHNLALGDVLENKTWNPYFTMRGCKITKHRARNMMIKTPKKIIIENNYLSSEMSSIGLRGETVNWYESGAVEDVVIRNNHFFNCAHGGAEHAVLWVSPKLNKSFDKTELYDRNIIFEDNLIETFDNRIVWADRLDGLVFKGNTIKQTNGVKQLFPKAPLFDFENCNDINIIDNVYQGKATNFFETDEKTSVTLKVKKNKGFSYKK